MQIRLGGPWLALSLIAAGAWFLARELFNLGPWFAPATVGGLTLGCGAAYALGWRRQRLLAAFWVLLSWTAYLVLQVVLPGGLPFAAFFAFLGLGFLAHYAFGARPAIWPLVPASILLGLGTLLWILQMGLDLAPYLIPILLIGYGVWLLARRSDRNPG